MLEATLAEKTISNVTVFLSDKGSNLAGESHHAILALLKALEAGLTDDLEAAFHLASIDPGIGKTVSVAQFLKAWKANGFRPISSVLIGVSRLGEIESYLRHAGLDRDDIAVLTRDDDMNALGVSREDHGSAPVMFTTQQMIQSRTRGRSFAEASEFHYADKPRALRVWDESLLPAEDVTIRVDDLGLFASPLRLTHGKFVEALKAFQRTLWDAKPGDTITIPQVLADLVPAAKLPEDQRKLLAQLARAGGQDFLLLDVRKGDIKLAGAVPSIPDDFAPAVILDASGRVRTTYSIWEKHRGTLRRLPSAANDYQALAVHLWMKPSGQRSLESLTKRRDVVEAIANRINESTPAEWLIVHYRGNEAIFSEVMASVQAEPGRNIHSLTWGQHHGLNDFADVPNVVIVGQLTYDGAAYPARAAAAAGKPAGTLGEALWGEVRVGEFQHHLLQAVCRASARRSRDGQAGYCRAFVIASPFEGIEDRVKETFPGCRLFKWEPAPQPLEGRVAQAADYLRKRFADASVERVTKKEVYEAIGMKATNFGTDVIRHLDFADFLGREHVFVNHNHFEKHRPAFEPLPGGWVYEDDAVA